jgi:hypothetical protein
MTTLVEKIYLAAANVGFLKACVWHPTDGGVAQTHSVGFSAPDPPCVRLVVASFFHGG